MKLIELLDVFNDNTYVKVYNMYDRCIAIYDGKNSIPDLLNKFDVLHIYTTGTMKNIINIIIDTELTYDDVYMLS